MPENPNDNLPRWMCKCDMCQAGDYCRECWTYMREGQEYCDSYLCNPED